MGSKCLRSGLQQIMWRFGNSSILGLGGCLFSHASNYGRNLCAREIWSECSNLPSSEVLLHKRFCCPESPSATFGVSFFAVFVGVPDLRKRRGILLPPGACQENDTCFLLFCCVSPKRDTLKMTFENDTLENDTWTR